MRIVLLLVSILFVWNPVCDIAWAVTASEFVLSPQDFGAKADGVTDDSEAIQAALDGGRRIYLPAGNYRVTRSLRVGSQTTIYGDGRATLIKGSFDAPVFASRNYFLDEDDKPTGGVVLRDLTIVGGDNPEHVNNHGILLRDFYSRLENLEIKEVGGHGVYLLDRRDDGRRSSAGTFVENRLVNVSVRGSHRTSFYLGEKGAPKFTDGYMDGCVSQSRNAIDEHLFVGSAGGWRIENFHGYGRATTKVGARIAGGFRTKIYGMHLQNFKETGLLLQSTQESVFVDSLSLDSDANTSGAFGVYIGRNANYEPHVRISGMSITKDRGDEEIIALYVAPKVTVDLPSAITVEGKSSGAVKLFDVRGDLLSPASFGYHLSVSLQGEIAPGTHRRILGPIGHGGRLSDLIIAAGRIQPSTDGSGFVEARLYKLTAELEVALLTQSAKLADISGPGFSVTTSGVEGTQKAVIDSKLDRVSTGDLLVIEFTVGPGTNVSDIAATLTVRNTW